MRRFEAPQAVSKVLENQIQTADEKAATKSPEDRNPERKSGKSETLIPDQNWKLRQLRQKCWRRDQFGGK